MGFGNLVCDAANSSAAIGIRLRDTAVSLAEALALRDLVEKGLHGGDESAEFREIAPKRDGVAFAGCRGGSRAPFRDPQNSLRHAFSAGRVRFCERRFSSGISSGRRCARSLASLHRAFDRIGVRRQHEGETDPCR